MSKSFFKIVKKKRKELNISQEKLAEILNISTVKMSNIENGEAEADLELCIRAADALDIPAKEIFNGHEKSYFDAIDIKNTKRRRMCYSMLAVVILLIISVVSIKCYRDYKTGNREMFVVISYEDDVLCLKKREPGTQKDSQNRYYVSMSENMRTEYEKPREGDVIYVHYYLELLPTGTNSGMKIESIKLCNELKVI